MLRVALLAALAGRSSGDYYSDMGLRRDASASAIKSAYREAAKRDHPDKNPGDPDAAERFRRVARAYETLGDAEKRRLYDVYGEDYEREQQRQAQQQAFRQRQEDFFGFGGRRGGRRAAPPIFSSTAWLGAESYRDLVEDSGESWLVQFYHDWSEPCKDFAPRWEALAAKLPPMVRLGRVNVDQNFGLVQRYRSFVRCRQTVLSVECTVPALVLVTRGEQPVVAAGSSCSRQQLRGRHCLASRRRAAAVQPPVRRAHSPALSHSRTEGGGGDGGRERERERECSVRKLLSSTPIGTRPPPPARRVVAALI